MSVELTTRYLGLELRSPIVASAAPHNAEPAMAARLEEAGVGAIVLPSLFEEEILAEDIGLNLSLEQGTQQFAEALSYFPAVDSFTGAADRYVASIERLKGATTVPIIASLNATTTGGWIRYAREIEGAGAEGLVLFNRFYQPDIDLETGDVVPRLQLSEPSELRLPLRWIAILRPQFGPAVSLALSSGVRTGEDVVKGLMVGADVVMMTSALLRDGPEHAKTVEAGLRAWMTDHEYVSVDQLRGSASAARVDDPAAFERANYMTTLRSWTTPPELTSAAPERRR